MSKQFMEPFQRRRPDAGFWGKPTKMLVVDDQMLVLVDDKGREVFAEAMKVYVKGGTL